MSSAGQQLAHRAGPVAASGRNPAPGKRAERPRAPRPRAGMPSPAASADRQPAASCQPAEAPIGLDASSPAQSSGAAPRGRLDPAALCGPVSHAAAPATDHPPLLPIASQRPPRAASPARSAPPQSSAAERSGPVDVDHQAAAELARRAILEKFQSAGREWRPRPPRPGPQIRRACDTFGPRGRLDWTGPAAASIRRGAAPGPNT